jgi:hypothetical protein
MGEVDGYIGMYIGALARGFDTEGNGTLSGVRRKTVFPFASLTAGSTVDCPKALCPENDPRA